MPGAPVVAVHAWSARDAAGGVTIPYLIDWETLEDEQQELLAARFAAAAHRFPDVLVDHVVARVDAVRPSSNGPLRSVLNWSSSALPVTVVCPPRYSARPTCDYASSAPARS
ncbi:hypothetical protein R1CP_37065 (plasmid) [Rhodococcus opacus]|uniref:Uncharacterized protein n=1 Tax=Rhodococcus opacus TaxID=37919 RepID=A0A1B1KHE2_RHOOP|nr:hypothetical protein [Rhodococcus opacus]ANS32019.1 hypothetical protein R1CP_37065 [Rhodococcus opacus]